MGRITAVSLILAGAFVASGGASTPERATLRILDRDPLTLRGQGFESRERVRVTLSAPASARELARANRAGTFRVLFDGVATDRCNAVRVVALGGEGTRAVLKILPAPACLIQRAP